jgi:hypothetical protein
MSQNRTAYTFGPLEQRGLVAGISAGQLTVAVAGLLVAIVAVDASPSAAGAGAGVLAIAVSALMAVVPAGDRPLCDWLSVAAAFLWRRLRGRGPDRAALATCGATATLRTDGALELDALSVDPPRQLRGVEILEISYKDRRVGALAEQDGRLLTAVLACRASSFAMLDPEAQERRLARWGLLLSGAATTVVRRIQWIERTVPAQGDELARYLHAERDPAVPLRGAPMIESYLELIDATARVTHEHEILLAVQIDARKVGAQDAEAALVHETERIAQSLDAAEVSVLGALTRGRLAKGLRTAFDPYARAELTALEAADHTRDGIDPGDAWPVGEREEWDHYRSDGALNATFWIAGWPRVGVSPMFMDAILGRSSSVRSVAVTFEPVPAARSTREVEAAITRDRADRELRRRFGQSETARQRQAQEATARREGELAAGHGEVRLAGFVTVSGRDEQELRRACAEINEHAARARLELRRMYGQQAEAFTFTLPLCRGLR